MDSNEFLESTTQFHEDCCSILKKKNADYTGDNSDPFKNFKRCESFDVTTAKGILVRMNDKMGRIEALTSGHHPKVAESLRDTCLDLSNYAAILSAWIDSQTQKDQENL